MFKNRHSIRLKGYDYASTGYYFVTICVNNREHMLGEIVDGQMVLNEIGCIVESIWNELPKQYLVNIDSFVVMPNHFHGIIEIRRGLIHQTHNDQGMINHAPTWQLMKQSNVPLGKIIRFFKAKTTKSIHENNHHIFSWQRNYYERIIRNDAELRKMRQYIQNNPVTWESDENNI